VCSRPVEGLVAVPLKTIVEIRFKAAIVVVLKTIEEQGILESFSRLPQAEREIIRQLLDKFGSQRVAAVRFPVPFGPKSINERRRFLSPIYKLIRYHRLIFDSVADGVFRSTYLPWIDSITHVKVGDGDLWLFAESSVPFS
jgi:hypothetical protein